MIGKGPAESARRFSQGASRRERLAEILFICVFFMAFTIFNGEKGIDELAMLTRWCWMGFSPKLTRICRDSPCGHGVRF